MTDNPVPFRNASARERISRVVEAWFLTEPLLFAAWTLHDVQEQPGIANIRVGNGRIEFNPTFVRSLNRKQLGDVLTFEVTRILLGHPYARKQPDAELSYSASNLTVQECLRTALPIPRARECFDDASFDNQFFEFYYRELSERSQDEGDENSGDDSDSDSAPGNANVDQQSEASEEPPPPENDEPESDQPQSTSSSEHGIESYADATHSGIENTQPWNEDELKEDEIRAAVREAAESEGWGTVGHSMKEQLLATLRPKLNYRGILRSFRQNVLSVNRRLTRTKPNRRYGLAQMGSRYDFTTRLLLAVDVSGSMTSRDIQQGFSIVRQFFRYGIDTIDVVWFDDQIRGPILNLRRARTRYEITGRGATSFTPIMELIDRKTDYDGLIVFTDGFAPIPTAPQNRRTRILWLMKNEDTYLRLSEGLRTLGAAAYLQESTSKP